MQESAPSPAAPVRKKTTTARPSAKKTAPKAPVGKAPSKTPSKSASKAGTTPKPTKSAQAVKAAKPKKAKLVRDSFTLPKDEYTALAELKQRCAQLKQPCKKSELLRAGIKALTALSDKSLLAALKAVPALKTGRPKKD